MPEPTKDAAAPSGKLFGIPADVIASTDTWLLCMDHDEIAIAEQWLEQNLPAKLTQKRLTPLIDLHMLHEDSVVIPMMRAPGKQRRLPLLETTKAADGERLSEPTSIEKLLAEMELCGAIVCKAHWDASVNRYGGKLRRSSFLEALGIMVSPACPKLLDAASYRNGQLASELVLRWL